MVVIDQHSTESGETYTNVLEASKLRPDVEPFVPKAQNGQQCYVVNNGNHGNNGGFSLDAPEFIPNVYPNSENMYTWVPNQFVVPSTNHPRFSIPRFRDKFMRQHRNRGYNNNNGNNNNNNNTNHHNNGRSRNNNHYDNNEYKHTYQQQRTFNKIEQRSDRNKAHQNGLTHHYNNNSQKQIEQPKPELHPKLDPKPSLKPEHSPDTDNAELRRSPIPVPDLPLATSSPENNVMSYRAALVGKQTAECAASNDKPVDTQAHSPPPTEQRELEAVKLDPETRPEKRSEKFIPRGEEQALHSIPPYKSHYNRRPKPTKGSGIQLNIFTLVQASEDKKGKKKKVAKNVAKVTVCNKTANPMDATAPEVRRGKEREEGKPKKLSKMKKIIVKERQEAQERLVHGPTREYCAQVVTPELNTCLSNFLAQLREYNDKAYRHGSSHKRRYCCGLREARKYLKLNKVKCIIIPPNIDKIVTKGGLDDCVDDIVNLSSQQNVPIFYGLNKTNISKLLARPKSTITSAVSVFSYDGAESLYKEVLHYAEIARTRYQELKNKDSSDPEEQSDNEEEQSSDGEEFEDDNNERDEDRGDMEEEHDNDSVSSSFVDSGIENIEISSLSLENGHTSGEG